MKRLPVVFALAIICYGPMYSMKNKAIKAFAVGSGISIVATPIVGPGIHYYKENLLNKKLRPWNSENCFKGFVGGTLCGMIPFINIIHLGDKVMDDFGGWVYDAVSCKSKWDKGFEIGLYSGLSLYVTVPLALKLAKKLKI